MNLTGDGGVKHVAVTARKTKPDGSREVTHRVEHHAPMVAALRKAKTNRRTQRGVKDDFKPLKPRDTTGIHHHIAGSSERSENFRSTLDALRSAFAGDGRLERPAPGDLPDRIIDYGRMAGAGDTIMTPMGRRLARLRQMQRLAYAPYYPELQPIGTPVPRYKGG